MRRSYFLLVLALCFGLSFAVAQPPGGGGRGLPAPKNLKVLTPQDNVIQTMFAIRSGLGVQCTFCHNPQDYSSDEIDKKLTARKMLQMVKDINANTFNGEQKVQCWTCHRGQEKPEAPPPPQAPGGRGGGRGPGGPPPGGAPPAPPAQ